MKGAGKPRRREFVKGALLAGPGLLLPWSCGTGGNGENPRIAANLNTGWSFHLGGLEGAETPSFAAAGWPEVDLPHDWSIEGEYASGRGAEWQSGYLPAGIGWYRKRLPWEETWQDKKVRIHFEGVYLASDVWINGNHLGHCPNGSIGIEYDLTGRLTREANVITVRVDHSRPLNARRYVGSGIYRPVWLLVTGPVHVATWGVQFSTPVVSEARARFELVTRIVNDSGRGRELSLRSVLKNPDGSEAAVTEDSIAAPGGAPQRVRQSGTVTDPRLWSPDAPNLYTLRSEIREDGRLLDAHETRVGIRSIDCSPASEVRLNGAGIELKGVREQHTAGAVGSAIPDDVLRQRLTLLKNMGCNAVRSLHHAVSPALYSLCDELGILVLDEAGAGWNEEDLSRFARRNGSHACVIRGSDPGTAWRRTRGLSFAPGFDYLGGANRWPARLTDLGVIDTCAFPKDDFYRYQSLWARKPMVHIRSHWTHPGKEGLEIPVVAYTNCDSVELFLNGHSLGEQACENGQCVWKVPYEAGRINAVAKKEGLVAAESARQTAGKAAAIRMSVDRRNVRANGADVVRLEVDVVDGNGILVPLAKSIVRFQIEGPARLIGVDNGDPLDLSPYKVDWRRAFRGKCLGLLQAGRTAGTIRVRAAADGLKTGEAVLTAV